MLFVNFSKFFLIPLACKELSSRSAQIFSQKKMEI